MFLRGFLSLLFFRGFLSRGLCTGVGVQEPTFVCQITDKDKSVSTVSSELQRLPQFPGLYRPMIFVADSDGTLQYSDSRNNRIQRAKSTGITQMHFLERPILTNFDLKIALKMTIIFSAVTR